MKYPQLNSLVPEGEHFDESAVNEGVWLSVGHLNTIENALANSSTAVEAVQEKLDEANASLQTQTERVTELETALQTAQSASSTSMEEKDALIVELQAKVVELGGKPSGNGSVVAAIVEDKPEDTSTSETGLPQYNSADHPLKQVLKSVKR